MQCARSISPAGCVSPSREASKLASRFGWATTDHGQVLVNTQMAGWTNAVGQDPSTSPQPRSTYWQEELHRLRAYRPKPSRFLREALMLQTYASDDAAEPAGPCGMQ